MEMKELKQLSYDCLTYDNRPEDIKKIAKRPMQSLYYKFAFELTRITKPKLIVELGTNRGGSTIHFKKGYPDAQVITVDILQKHNRDFLVENEIYGLEGDSVKMAKFVPDDIDILFIDSLHTYDHVMAEVKAYFPKMKKGGIVLVDDITLDEGMKKAWAEMPGEKEDVGHLHPHPGFGVIIV